MLSAYGKKGKERKLVAIYVPINAKNKVCDTLSYKLPNGAESVKSKIMIPVLSMYK